MTKIAFLDGTISSDASLREALETINRLLKDQGPDTLFVLNSEGKVIGTLTDGDIRRALLGNASLDFKVEKAMNRGFRYLTGQHPDLTLLKEMKAGGLRFCPLLDSQGCILRIIDFEKTQTILPVTVFIMAGGRGQRLSPLTDNLPKPLLKVGSKPIMEHNIDRLIRFGIKEIYISVNYLADQIKSYFKNGHSKGINIHYIHEEQPLGTMGSVSKLPSIENEILMVCNSDILTNINYEALYESFLEKDSDFMAATAPYQVSIPYGIFDVSFQGEISGLKEKPVFTFYSNAGIYLIKKKFISLIPQGKFFNATDLIEKMMGMGLKVHHFPILSYWLDIGLKEDYLKAQEDIKQINLS